MLIKKPNLDHAVPLGLWPREYRYFDEAELLEFNDREQVGIIMEIDWGAYIMYLTRAGAISEPCYG